jgi:hypothetical protein
MKKYHELRVRDSMRAAEFWFIAESYGIPGDHGTFHGFAGTDDNDPSVLIEVPGYGAFIPRSWRKR